MSDKQRRVDDEQARELMVRYQAGDLEAFDELYARLVPAVRGVLRRKVTDPARVDDLAQETFLQMHRARHTYDPAYPVMPWLLAIARHVWLMQRRSASRRPHASESLEATTRTARGEAEVYADRAAVRDALGALPATRRQAVVWHHLWGLSFREIATRAGIRETAAKLRSSRGMAQLRALLGRWERRD